MSFKLKRARLAFPSIWRATAVKGSDSGEKAFSCSLIIPKNHPQIAEIKKAMRAVADEKWGAKAATVYKALEAAGKLALRDGDTKPEYEGFEGNYFISCRSKVKPSTFNRQREEVIEADGIIYAGCWVNASIEFWAQDNDFGKRVNAQIRGLQFVEDDDAFAGGARAADKDEFDDEIGAPDESEEEDDLTA